MDTTNVNRVEVIDHTKGAEDGIPICYTSDLTRFMQGLPVVD